MSLKTIIEFVKNKHEGQVDLAGEPYFNHLSRVANKLQSPFRLEAYLHDIFEDTDATVQELLSLGVHEGTISNVITLTKRKDEDYESYISRIKLNSVASLVKIADLEDNMNICRLKVLTDRDIDRIKKSFQFDYGHRVWSQSLQEEFSCDTELKCRFLHGHRGVVEVSLSSHKLNEGGMVTDFKHLNWFKKFLDEVLDHKTIIDIHDPALHILFPLVESNFLVWEKGGYAVFPDLQDRLLNELYRGIVIVQFVPTSENLSKWLQEIVQEKIRLLDPGITAEITFYETPSSCSHYSSI